MNLHQDKSKPTDCNKPDWVWVFGVLETVCLPLKQAQL